MLPTLSISGRHSAVLELLAGNREQLREAAESSNLTVTTLDVGGLICDAGTGNPVARIVRFVPGILQVIVLDDHHQSPPIATLKGSVMLPSDPSDGPQRYSQGSPMITSRHSLPSSGALPLRRRHSPYGPAVRFALRRARLDDGLPAEARNAAAQFLRDATTAEWQELIGGAEDLGDADPGIQQLLEATDAEAAAQQPRLFQRVLAWIWEHRQEILALVMQILAARTALPGLLQEPPRG